MALLVFAVALSALASTALAADAPAPFRFRRHTIDVDLPAPGGVGDYGQTALVDLDRDGKLDFVLGRKGGGQAGPLLWYRYESPDRWSKHVVGYDTRSDVGLAALDVDADGWSDLVTSGVWYRNPGEPRSQSFERIVFDPKAGGAHDVLAADLNGDGRQDLALLGDDRTELDALAWYEVSADPRQPWTKHVVGPGVHGAITPHGAGDLDGDGDLDLVRADTWFENSDSRALKWSAHRTIPFGRVGPFGLCVRAAVVDMTGDGRAEIVMADADIEDSRGGSGPTPMAAAGAGPPWSYPAASSTAPCTRWPWPTSTATAAPTSPATSKKNCCRPDARIRAG